MRAAATLPAVLKLSDGLRVWSADDEHGRFGLASRGDCLTTAARKSGDTGSYLAGFGHRRVLGKTSTRTHIIENGRTLCGRPPPARSRGPLCRLCKQKWDPTRHGAASDDP
jgi:hypothetical protein